MYRTLIRTEKGAIDRVKQRVCLPVLAAYEIHSVHIDFIDSAHYESVDFRIEVPFVVWLNNCTAARMLGDEEDDCLYLHVDYFYRKADSAPECKLLADGLIDSTFRSSPSTKEIDVAEKRKEIFTKHYISGHFALDNGLFKEAVVNFETVVEVLLNTELKYANLRDLIERTPLAPSYHDEMSFIGDCRNKVHPERLRDVGDVSRADAMRCRQDLALIINEIADLDAF